MRKARVLSIILLILILGFVTACNSGGGTTSEPNTPEAPAATNNPPAAEEPKAEPEPEPEPEEPVINMNGESLKIMHWLDGPNPDTPEGELTLARWKEVEEKYNVKIEWVKVPWGEPIKLITQAALSGEAPADIVALDYYYAIPAAQEGLLLPIDDFFDFDDPKWPTNMKKLSTYKGHQYGFTSMNNNASGLYFNKTLLEREGLPNPHDLVEQGNWTWETFLEIAKAATKDTNGDGVTDQWGIVNTPVNLMRILVHSNGGALVKENSEGIYEFTAGEPKALEALNFYASLYNEHKVVMPPAGDTWSSKDYADSQTVFNAGQAAFVTGELWEGETRTTMTDEQGFVYFPKGPGRPDEWQGSVENFVPFYMPATVTRAAEKAKIWEEIQMWDRVEENRRELAEQQLLSDERDIEAMLDLPNYSEPVFNPIGGAGSALAYGLAVKGESPETVIEQNKQIAQDAIDNVYNKTE